MMRKRSLKLVNAARKRSRIQSQNINLDQLVEERKEEKRKALKEKLEQKLTTIRDRRAFVTNHEPFPEGTFDLLASNNTWEEVLGYLNDPVDFNNAYHTCRKFAGILENRLTLVVMPKMLTTLKASIPSKNWRRICFNIRGVSKAWKEIANFQLFDAPFSKADWFYGSMMQSEFDSDWRSTSCVFEHEESVDQATSILSRQGQGQATSFSMRNVMLILTNEGASERFYKKVIEFFQKHGGSVWFFSFKWDWGYTGNVGESYEKLCEMLESMPELKGLDLCDFDPVRFRPVEEIQRVNGRPLPVAGSLEHLYFSMASGVPLLSQILKKCVNLKSVVYELFQEALPGETIESLKGLKVERYCGPATPIISSAPALAPINAVWPLRHLAMDLDYLEGNVRASVLFPALNCFRETLEYLQILDGGILMDTRSVRLDLPRLEFLLLETIGRKSLGFDDLLLLKSLKKLSVMDKFRDEDPLEFLNEDKNAKVKVAKYLNDLEMDKSNVWKWFPDLMWIEMGHDWTFYRPDEQ